MNPIYESLMNRKSTRVFEKKTIEPNLKSHILEAAFQAPTAGAQNAVVAAESFGIH
jgi:nitroreductase